MGDDRASRVLLSIYLSKKVTINFFKPKVQIASFLKTEGFFNDADTGAKLF